ncbi:MAG: DUF3316 domain-containing protein [Paludibacter sp.]|nr:DUF3316 domain-containing protein [Paludibacter sp.]
MPCTVFAQNAQNYHLTNTDWQMEKVWTGLNDPYLSPLRYIGSGVAVSWNNKGFFLKNSEKFIETYNISAFYNYLLNPAHTASMLYAGGNANYGVHYRLQAIKNLSFLLGASTDIDLGFRYLARNSNNPFNMDLAANLNFSAAAQLKIFLFKYMFQVDMSARTPLVGAMFVPEQGASYYEMGTFDDGLRNVLHFSHLGNKHGLHTTLGLDLPIWKLTIRISGNAELLKFKTNAVVYNRSTIGLGIGLKYSFITFAGRKNLPPENFINPE